ncbi:MAG: adenylosuccinate synthase [Chitinophagales bacterium]|nr:adenylosuccinate synthase [Chitinophagales bacterium]
MVDVLLGLQWGDEGKGKIVDYLAPDYDVVARFQGGPNAGHTLNIDGRRIVLHTIPSGVFHDRPLNLIGNGVVIDPCEFKKEVDELTQTGIDLNKKLLISQKAHLILPTHRMLDSASEKSKGAGKIGSTLKGIGPAYMDKTGRNGIRVGDLFSDNFRNRYDQLKQKHLELLGSAPQDFDLQKMEDEFWQGIEVIRSFNCVRGEYFINTQLHQDKKVLAEGAQGSMLDIDFGTYPFVTSSNTITAAACTGLGIPPTSIREVIGIIKAYCTRVGGGPFPTELTDETGELMRKEGHEFGATTGRPRRCGWLDLVAVNYTIMLNGVTKIVITKADVLNVFEEVKVCSSYRTGHEVSHQIPFDINTASIIPQYETLAGWKTNHSMKSADDLPGSLSDFVRFVAEKTKTAVSMISIGAGRDQLVVL